jgi:hypothetical protein
MTKIQQEQKFLSLEDISRIYRIPLSTLRRWASERRFPLYKISSRIKVSVTDWESWIEGFYIGKGK